MNTRAQILTEHKLHELSCVIDDLTSLRSTPEGLSVLAENNYALRAVQNRLSDLVRDSQLELAE